MVTLLPSSVWYPGKELLLNCAAWIKSCEIELSVEVISTLHVSIFGDRLDADVDCLPLLRHVIEKGNTTVFEWQTGQPPLKVIETPFVLEAADEDEDQEKEEKVTDRFSSQKLYSVLGIILILSLLIWPSCFNVKKVYIALFSFFLGYCICMKTLCIAPFKYLTKALIEALILLINKLFIFSVKLVGDTMWQNLNSILNLLLLLSRLIGEILIWAQARQMVPLITLTLF